MNNVKYERSPLAGLCLRLSRYNNSILASLDIIGEKCCKFVRASRPEDIRQTVRQYLSHIETLRNIAAWADPTDSEEEDLSFGSDSIELQNLLKLTEDLDTLESGKHWEDVEWKIEEPSDMFTLFCGSETRIEQVRLCDTTPVASSDRHLEIPLHFTGSSEKASGTNHEFSES
jgi:hypothetical protein